MWRITAWLTWEEEDVVEEEEMDVEDYSLAYMGEGGGGCGG